MDLTTLFGIIAFAAGWLFWRRTDPRERLVRLFFGVLMFMGAAIGFLSLLLRLTR
ncbi:MAG: hypothetical protein ACFCUO_10595 [Rhodospirillales bacterium]